MTRYLLKDSIKAVTSKQMREIDEKTIHQFHLPGIVLMENAGIGCTEEIERYIVEEKIIDHNISIFCGKGNNGGDGFVVARHLFNKGHQPDVYLIGNESDLKGDALTNYKAYCSFGKIVKKIENAGDLKSINWNKIDLIVDAIFGNGIKGSVEGFALEVINAINKANPPVVAIDIPSGLPTDTAICEGECIKADLTCTIGLPKISQLLYPAKDRVGKLIVLDIGFPRFLLVDPLLKINWVNKDSFKDILKSKEHIEIDELEIENVQIDPIGVLGNYVERVKKNIYLKGVNSIIVDTDLNFYISS